LFNKAHVAYLYRQRAEIQQVFSPANCSKYPIRKTEKKEVEAPTNFMYCEEN